MKPATTHRTAATTTEGMETPWFIFTDRQSGHVVEAANITKAVAKWRALNRRADAGEIVAVIKGAGHFESYGRIVNTPIYGMVVCVEQASEKAGETCQNTKGVSS